MNRRLFLRGSAASILGLTIKPIFAHWTPRRPINAIVPYGAGGGTDMIARALAASARDILPVPMVIVNKPGASGIVGTMTAAKSRADGSTVLITSAGSLILNSLMKDLKVDPFDDFIVVAQVGDLHTSVMVSVNSPFQSIQDLLKTARAHPGSLRWAHQQRGSFHHIAGQAFLNAAGLAAVDVGFKGGAATRAAVMGDQVDFGMLGIQHAAGFADKLRPLALVASERDPFAPDVPTFAELGIEVALISSPIVVFVPAGSSEEVITALQEFVQKAAAREPFKQLMAHSKNVVRYLPGTDTRNKLLRLRDEAQVIVSAIK